MSRLVFLVFVSALLQASHQQQSHPTYHETVTVEHSYYKMELYKHNAQGMYDRNYVDMSKEGGVVHEFLSNHSQAAEAVAPGFEFPFYGHMVDKFFITTHGFLSFAPRLHNLMYKTQYVAPLRVKLDPSASETSTINYLSREDSLTIQWTNVSVAEPYAHPLGGNFTFQVTLKKSGDIVFVYEHVPDLLTSDALYDEEPVAGLSDAFLIGDSELHVYHTLNVENPDIMSETVVVFTAKPTCIQQQDCESCAALRAGGEFECSWCAKVHRCSDGADRLREHWDAKLCGDNNSTGADACATSAQEEHHTEWRSSMNVDANEILPESSPVTAPEDSSSSGGPGVGAVISGIVSAVLLVVLAGLVLAFVYLYGRRNPGGFAEQVAMRLEANYKRFGGDEEAVVSTQQQQQQQRPVEMNSKTTENNNSITVSF